MRPAAAFLFLLPLAATCAHSPPRTQTDEFADCVKRTGTFQLGTDKGAQLGAEVKVAAANVKTLAELKDKLDEKYTPNGDTCLMRDIVEGCFATANRTSRREVNCSEAPKQGAAPSVDGARLAASTSSLGRFVRKQPSPAVASARGFERKIPSACAQENVPLCGCLPEDMKQPGPTDMFAPPQIYDIACCEEVGSRVKYRTCGTGHRCDDSGNVVHCVATREPLPPGAKTLF